MKVFEFDGTPEEYAAYVAIREGRGRGEEKTVEANHSQSTALVAFFRRVLTRRDLSDNSKRLLAALYEAGDAGLLRDELARRVGVDDSQLSGVLGAFGRRIEATEGISTVGRPSRKGTGHMMDFAKVAGVWRYTLIPEARQAIEAETDNIGIL